MMELFEGDGYYSIDRKSMLDDIDTILQPSSDLSLLLELHYMCIEAIIFCRK